MKSGRIAAEATRVYILGKAPGDLGRAITSNKGSIKVGSMFKSLTNVRRQTRDSIIIKVSKGEFWLFGSLAKQCRLTSLAHTDKSEAVKASHTRRVKKSIAVRCDIVFGREKIGGHARVAKEVEWNSVALHKTYTVLVDRLTAYSAGHGTASLR